MAPSVAHSSSGESDDIHPLSRRQRAGTVVRPCALPPAVLSSDDELDDIPLSRRRRASTVVRPRAVPSAVLSSDDEPDDIPLRGQRQRASTVVRPRTVPSAVLSRDDEPDDIPLRGQRQRASTVVRARAFPPTVYSSGDELDGIPLKGGRQRAGTVVRPRAPSPAVLGIGTIPTFSSAHSPARHAPPLTRVDSSSEFDDLGMKPAKKLPSSANSVHARAPLPVPRSQIIDAEAAHSGRNVRTSVPPSSVRPIETNLLIKTMKFCKNLPSNSTSAGGSAAFDNLDAEAVHSGRNVRTSVPPSSVCPIETNVLIKTMKFHKNLPPNSASAGGSAPAFDNRRIPPPPTSLPTEKPRAPRIKSRKPAQFPAPSPLRAFTMTPSLGLPNEKPSECVSFSLYPNRH
jgi:hypothetical protein